MENHGSESYFVLGEGLLAEAGGGRELAIAAPPGAPPGAPPVPPFRFSRMGPKGAGKQLGKPNRLKIAQAMTIDDLAPGQIPAGFTYLGQFIDHDLTADNTNLAENVDVNPAALTDGRSPSLDLDSLYGNGPATNPEFYDADGLHLKQGTASGGPAGTDLPRRTTGAIGQAIIPDDRNDENLAVAQVHCAFIRFHNRVIDTVVNTVPAPQRFREARKIVTKHYQWMIKTDYLPRVCAGPVVTDVFTHNRKIFEVGVPATTMPTMPVEFSVAGFRLGHSMVRAVYSWNKNFPGATLQQLFDFTHHSNNMAGPLPGIWPADYRRLFDFSQIQGVSPSLIVPANQFNRAMRIDTKLVNPLATLPVPEPAPENNLAFRNLLRANMVKLATGQQMFAFVKSKGIAVTQLTKPQIRDGNGGANLGSLNATQLNALVTNTPLWFYILREAEFNNGRLHGVGARIVAETFHRAIQGSSFSIIRDAAFRPTLGPNSQTFRMVDLLHFAFNGSAALLNPAT
jgi:hypothetical protein